MTDNDGRVTLAVISNQIENIQTDVGEINGKMDETNKALNGLTVKTAVIEKGQESFDKAIEGLQQKSNRNDVFVIIGNMIVVAIGSAASYLGIRK